MTPIQAIYYFVEARPTRTGPPNVGIGAILLLVAAAVFIAWVAWLWIAARPSSGGEEPALNLQPYISDEELENGRLNRVLRAAMVSAAVLALVLPIYYVNEPGRQVKAAEALQERDVEEGARWFTEFSCAVCHAANGAGGGASFIEGRSGLDVSWAAPSLNDIFYRFDEIEIQNIIIHGRQGTPMPPNGIAGGGAMTWQEVEQVMAYIKSFEISQGDVLREIEPAVEAALKRIATGDEALATLIVEQQAVIDDIAEAPSRFDPISDFPEQLSAVLGGDGTCTNASAALVDRACGSPGTDTDRDGVADKAEALFNDISKVAFKQLQTRTVNSQGEIVFVETPALSVTLDPTNAFSTTAASGSPINDLDAIDGFLTVFGARHINLQVMAERNEAFAATAQASMDYLVQAAADRKWFVDFSQVAADTDLSVGEAERAVGLYNAYCAQCHTAGYAAGVGYEQQAGSGAWAPSLLSGRANQQFLRLEDHVKFILKGTQSGQAYGLNGLGTGRMPAFGKILTQRDIELIAIYERSM
ncbi:cytochrome c6 [bacterium BMS3Bbin02]|nr:cytochrome c6 [bacterium BMS3Bbin02]